MVPILAGALAACSPTPAPHDSTPTDTGAGDTAPPIAYASWSGTEVFEYGLFPEPGLRTCLLRFVTTGTPSEACPACVFAFEVARSFQPESSLDDGTCAILAVDDAWTYGYFADLDGAPTVARLEGDAWVPWGRADLDRDTGVLTYENGVFDEPLSGSSEGWYSTWGWRGEARLDPASARHRSGARGAAR